jgi:Spherulation-specific family 4/Fibronectin type III domain
MFRRSRTAATVVAVAAATVVLVTPAPASASHVAAHQKIAFPAYVGPDTPSGAEMFQRLAQNWPTNDITVVNGSQNKAEAPFNQAWADAIKKVHDGGPMVLAYVDTGYYGVEFPPFPAHNTRANGPGGGGHSFANWTDQIEADIDEWYSLYGSYGIDGIFLDQGVEPCGTQGDPDLYVDLYAAVSDYISLHHPDAYIVLNPGVPVDQCYEDIADTIITFEGTYSDYMNDVWPTKAWQLNSTNQDKFWHLIYNVPNQSAMQEVVARSRNQNAGYVYVTDDLITYDGQGNITGFPWDTIPPYWNNELVTVANITDVTAPYSPYALAGSGLSGTSTAKVNLTWSNGDDDVATIDYEVYQGSTSKGWFTNNAATITGLSPNTTYSFKVRARDEVGNISSWTSAINVTTPAAAAAPILGPSACLSPSLATYQATYVDPFTYRRVFINSDNNTATGYNLGLPYPAGNDYMIENGFLYQYAGSGFNWNSVSGVVPLVSTTNDVYQWHVPTSAFTNAASTQVVVFQASSPDYYTSTLTVNQTASC